MKSAYRRCPKQTENRNVNTGREWKHFFFTVPESIWAQGFGCDLPQVCTCYGSGSHSFYVQLTEGFHLSLPFSEPLLLRVFITHFRRHVSCSHPQSSLCSGINNLTVGFEFFRVPLNHYRQIQLKKAIAILDRIPRLPPLTMSLRSSLLWKQVWKVTLTSLPFINVIDFSSLLSSSSAPWTLPFDISPTVRMRRNRCKLKVESTETKISSTTGSGLYQINNGCLLNLVFTNLGWPRNKFALDIGVRVAGYLASTEALAAPEVLSKACADVSVVTPPVWFLTVTYKLQKEKILRNY